MVVQAAIRSRCGIMNLGLKAAACRKMQRCRLKAEWICQSFLQKLVSQMVEPLPKAN